MSHYHRKTNIATATYTLEDSVPRDPKKKILSELVTINPHAIAPRTPQTTNYAQSIANSRDPRNPTEQIDYGSRRKKPLRKK